MKTPYCAIAINDVSQMTFTLVMEPGDTNPQVLSFPMHEYNADGLEASCVRLGKMIFTVLAQWYPEEFARFPHLNIPYSAQADLNLISGLIAASMESKTAAHIPSIQLLVDQLLQRDPTAMEQSVIIRWPETKSMLESVADFTKRRK